jgi:hypothetical protein
MSLRLISQCDCAWVRTARTYKDLVNDAASKQSSTNLRCKIADSVQYITYAFWIFTGNDLMRTDQEVRIIARHYITLNVAVLLCDIKANTREDNQSKSH